MPCTVVPCTNSRIYPSPAPVFAFASSTSTVPKNPRPRYATGLVSFPAPVQYAHPPAATAFACAGIPLDKPLLQEGVVQLGTVPVAPYALPGSQEVADSVAPFCKDYRAVLLEYHGAVAWGDSMQQAHYRLECLEQTALVTLHFRTLGCTRTMPPELVKDLEALRPAWGIR